jgi:predicted nucleic acid-binding protein
MTGRADLVLDASVALALALEEPLHDAARAVMTGVADAGSQCLVPDVFDAECAAGIAKAVRRGRLRDDLWTGTWMGLARLPVERRPSRLLGEAALQIAFDRGISAYDALYVALSAEEGVPLFTADARLARALSGTTYDVRLLGDLELG